MQGEYVDEMRGEPSLVLWDVAIDGDARRKGLGRHLLVLLELIARQTRMRFLSLPVMNGDDATRDWCVCVRNWRSHLFEARRTESSIETTAAHTQGAARREGLRRRHRAGGACRLRRPGGGLPGMYVMRVRWTNGTKEPCTYRHQFTIPHCIFTHQVYSKELVAPAAAAAAAASAPAATAAAAPTPAPPAAKAEAEAKEAKKDDKAN